MWFVLLLACSGSVPTKPDPDPDPSDLDRDGVTVEEGDCNDHDPSIFPGAEETFYDGIDQNCFEADDDDQDGDGFAFGVDCDDTNASANPMSIESCNGVDDDCDGVVDNDLGSTGYIDTDGDGYGEGDVPQVICDSTASVAEYGGDCDESNPSIHPDMPEACDGIDQDCDGVIDENVGSTGYPDVDQDGYGDASASPLPCGLVGVEDHSDCNDRDSSIHPSSPEKNDGLDNDCDVWIDEDFVAAGDLVISELSVDPVLGTQAQWVELHNVSVHTLHLVGWTFTAGGRSIELTGMQLAPSAVLVFCRSQDQTAAVNPSSFLTCDGVWTDASQPSDAVGPGFDNQLVLGVKDSVTLQLGSLVVDTVSWDESWSFLKGHTLYTGASGVGNDVASAWCASSFPDLWYDDGSGVVEYGTPGVLKSCPL